MYITLYIYRYDIVNILWCGDLPPTPTPNLNLNPIPSHQVVMFWADHGWALGEQSMFCKVRGRIRARVRGKVTGRGRASVRG